MMNQVDPQESCQHLVFAAAFTNAVKIIAHEHLKNYALALVRGSRSSDEVSVDALERSLVRRSLSCSMPQGTCYA